LLHFIFIGRTTRCQYHVQFFGEQKERGWIAPCRLISFEGRAAFEELAKQNANWAVSRSRLAAWEIAVAEAEKAVPMNRMERIQRLTFAYDSVLPTYLLSRLPPTPVETPDPPKRRGGKRKAVTNDEEARNTVARCIDILDEMSPPSKKRKKSLSAYQQSPFTSPSTSHKSVATSGRRVKDLANLSQDNCSSPKVLQKVSANMQREQHPSAACRVSPRKSLRNSLVDAEIDGVKGLIGSASADNNQPKKNALEEGNIGVIKSTPKQLTDVNDVGKDDSSRRTRYSSRVKNLNDMSNSEIAVDNNVGISELEGALDKAHQRVNGRIRFDKTPEKDDLKRLKLTQKSQSEGVEEAPHATASSNCQSSSEFSTMVSDNDGRRSSRGRSPRKSRSMTCDNAADKSPVKIVGMKGQNDSKSASGRVARNSLGNIVEEADGVKKSAKRHRSLPSSEVEKFDLDENPLKAGKRKTSGDEIRKNDSNSVAGKSSATDGNCKVQFNCNFCFLQFCHFHC
jgi:hypothetical protein